MPASSEANLSELILTPGETTLAQLEQVWRQGLAVRLDDSARDGIAASAARIARGLERDLDVIAFPAILAALARGALLVPEWLRSAGLSGFRFRNRPRR